MLQKIKTKRQHRWLTSTEIATLTVFRVLKARVCKLSVYYVQEYLVVQFTTCNTVR